MDRAQILLLGLPLFLFCTDLLNLFAPPPPPPHKPPHHHHHHHHLEHQPSPVAKETLDFPSQKPSAVGLGAGSTVKISFCTSCSYKGNAVTITKMLESSFPGIHVVLLNHPPPLPKRVLSKLVPVAQVGVFGIVMAGEQIFPMLGIMTPPPWYHSLRANRFGTIASTWLLGNALQSFLQGTGAFEVFLNDELVFSKLKEGRFPGEIELRDDIAAKLGSSRITDGLGAAALWS
ncbi:selT-like protein [Prunus avium]|uniref:SelT-like protein n=1 Tax=Prunus avium TaxID=42229 RepID=A0A6P5SJU7_PRUAV|nr:selT-like protein [Prunus avium]